MAPILRSRAPRAAGDGRVICRGLLEDWVTWQPMASPEFVLLRRALRELSASPAEPLVPGEPTRVCLDDARQYPTLELPYGRTPITLASAAVRRIVHMAYLMVWAWKEHRGAAALLRQDPERRMLVLFDEPETDLHPQWQRRILPGLLQVAAGLQADMTEQLRVSTHSPLVLASLEPTFDPKRDRLCHFRLDERRQATLEPLGFTRRGDVLAWLGSDAFGLRQARSVEAEEAIEAAKRFMKGEGAQNPAVLRTREQIDARLKALLGDLDSFWPRWIIKLGAS